MQSLLQGFAGIKFVDGGMVVRPVIVRTIAPRMVWRGLRIKSVVFRLEASEVADTDASLGGGGLPPVRTTLCVLKGAAGVRRASLERVAGVRREGFDEATQLLRAGGGDGGANETCETWLLQVGEPGLLIVPHLE